MAQTADRQHIVMAHNWVYTTEREYFTERDEGGPVDSVLYIHCWG